MCLCFWMTYTHTLPYGTNKCNIFSDALQNKFFTFVPESLWQTDVITWSDNRSSAYLEIAFCPAWVTMMSQAINNVYKAEHTDVHNITGW